MRIMWLCNTLMEDVAIKLGQVLKKPESWIVGLYSCLKKNPEYEFIYLFPSVENVEKIIDGTIFAAYPEKNMYKYDKNVEETLANYVEKYNPDVIHIFGTEMPHTYAMMKVAEKYNIQEKTVIHIQGIASKCAVHYNAFLPSHVVYGFTLIDCYRRNNVYLQRKKFEKRGWLETEALKLAVHVIGRTDWDRACVESINPNIVYHHCDELLRESFYIHNWKYESCEKFSIFVSQSNYSLKGFHLMLDAMTDIVKEYPNAHLYTTGASPLAKDFLSKLKQSYYSKYLGSLIKKKNLKNNVTFLGYLTEDEMCKRYLKSNVFVLCSSLENSPNSLGEAMILGVPSIASCVGGVQSMFVHNQDGFLYPADEPYMMSYYVQRIFKHEPLVEEFSENAQEHAKKTHDQDKIYNRIIEIYSEMQN